MHHHPRRRAVHPTCDIGHPFVLKSTYFIKVSAPERTKANSMCQRELEVVSPLLQRLGGIFRRFNEMSAFLFASASNAFSIIDFIDPSQVSSLSARAANRLMTTLKVAL